MSGTNSTLSINPAGQSQILYDYVGGDNELAPAVVDETMQSATLQYLAAYHPSGQGIVFGPLLQPDDIGKATFQISGLVVGATVYVYPSFYSSFYPYTPAGAQVVSYNIDSIGDITQPEGVQMSFTATAETETLTITTAGQVHALVEFYTVTASYLSTGSCTPFLRSVGVGDFALDGVTPYTVQGEVVTGCPQGESGSTCCEQTNTLLTDVVARLDTLVLATPPIPPEYYPKPQYSYHTKAYTVAPQYKSLTATFTNDGTINGKPAPAGYSFSHSRVDTYYPVQVQLDGTGFAVWEER